MEKSIETKIILSSGSLLWALTKLAFVPEEYYKISFRNGYLNMQGEKLNVEGRNEGDFLIEGKSFLQLRELLKRIEDQPITVTLSEAASHFTLSGILV